MRVRSPRPGRYRGRQPRPPREVGTNPARRSPADLDAALITALAAGPLMKWQLRDLLHEPEQAVYKQLVALRKAGALKVVGKTLIKRAWALKAWIPPAPAPQPPSAAPVNGGALRHKAPTTEMVSADQPSSWWVSLGRRELSQTAIARQESMSASKEALKVRGIIIG